MGHTYVVKPGRDKTLPCTDFFSERRATCSFNAGIAGNRDIALTNGYGYIIFLLGEGSLTDPLRSLH
jgi:hypothetical protein